MLHPHGAACPCEPGPTTGNSEHTNQTTYTLQSEPEGSEFLRSAEKTTTGQSQVRKVALDGWAEDAINDSLRDLE